MRGNVPPWSAAPGPAPKILFGDSVVGTDGAGRGYIAFPEEFNTIPVVVAMGGNGENITTFEPSATATTTGFAFYAYFQNGLNISSGAVRVRWHAVGF